MKDRSPDAKAPREYPEPWLIPHAVRPLLRFLLGRPMDNVIYTNATFFHRATTGYPSRWLWLAGWERALIRVGVTYALLAGVAGWAMDTLGLVSWIAFTVGHLSGLSVLLAPVLLLVYVRDWGVAAKVPVVAREGVRLRVDSWVPVALGGRKEWERSRVIPLARALDSVLQTSHRASSARHWVQIPKDYREPGRPVVIQLPASFTGADEGTKSRLTRTVAARLGMRDPDVSWQLEGDSPRVLLTTPVTPPKMVRWADVERYYLESQEYRPFLGLAGADVALYAEMIADSPHLALSAASGAGKSEMVKTIIMQALRWGWGVVILDWKEVSHEWAEGLPGVLILRDVEDIHDGLVTLSNDLDTRKRSYRLDKTLTGRAKVLVVYEEMNATSQLLVSYWAALRSTEPDPEVRRSMPVRSPAVAAQNALVFGGRQFGIHCLFMAQKFSNRVTQGNTDVRENFAIKLLARYSTSTVKMLAPDIKPFPRKPANLGAWVAVMGNDAVVFQAPLITDEEAREYSMGGVENPSHPLTNSYRPYGIQRPGMDTTLGGSLYQDATTALAVSAAIEGEVLPATDQRKLSEMVADLSHLGITHAVLRNAVARPEEGFPEATGGSRNRGYTYDFEMVKSWARKRHARMAAERES
jgi:hypothetical protein